jgi:outer membrane murein-binding lipoprotein Lpp
MSRIVSHRSPRAAQRTTAVVAAALLGSLALAGCTAGSDDASPALSPAQEYTTDSDARGAESAPLLDAGAQSSAGIGAADSAAGTSSFAADRQVISTGWATITADDPIDAAEDAVRIVEGAGGRVDGRSEQAPVDDALGQVTLTLRIPSATFNSTLDQLKELGRDISVETSATDVTTQTQDLDARIAALTTSVDRLLGLLASAGTTAELIEVETALASRQGELDSLQAQRRGLADQVSMATLTLTLVSEAEAPPQAPDTFWDSVVAGLAAFAAFFTAAFLALGYAVPWLVLLGVIVLVLVLVRRRRRAGSHSPESSNSTRE